MCSILSVNKIPYLWGPDLFWVEVQVGDEQAPEFGYVVISAQTRELLAQPAIQEAIFKAVRAS